MSQQMVETYSLGTSPTALHLESQSVTNIFIIFLLENTTFTKGCCHHYYPCKVGRWNVSYYVIIFSPLFCIIIKQGEQKYSVLTVLTELCQ